MELIIVIIIATITTKTTTKSKKLMAFKIYGKAKKGKK